MKVIIRSMAVLALTAATLAQQAGLDPAKLLTPGTDSWPTFNGDYSGRRYSALAHITAANVKSLSLAWLYNAPGGGTIKATPLMINGVLYFSTPDHAYAVEARTGRELWHYTWKSSGGNHLGNRGMGALGDTLYFETPDCHLVALNMHDGTERWNKVICSMEQFYYASVAPVIIKNHVIAGVSGDDMDNPGYLQAHDPVTGEMQWRWYVVPQKMDEPGSDTWPNEEAMKHGGGMTWQPVTYDPALNLLYVTTGNPQPVIAYKNRKGANLFTGSIVALNADSGKMAWYFQSSPHDTHDWDSTQTAVIFDGEIDGQAAQAHRAGRAQRPLLRARPHERQGHRLDRIRQDELGDGLRREGPADSESCEDAADRRRARVAGSRRRDQLAVADVQSANRPLLRERRACLQRVLPLRSQRQSGRVGRHRSRRLVRVDAARARLQDGQGALAPSVGRRHRALRIY